MEQEILRRLIRSKLADGRLPQNGFTLDASTCGTRSVACLAEVTSAQMNFQRTVPVSNGSLDRQWTMS
jgi:hypothetical protein